MVRYSDGYCILIFREIQNVEIKIERNIKLKYKLFNLQDDDADETIDTDATPVDRFRHGQTLPTDYDIATQSDDDVDAAGEDDGTWSRFLSSF